MADRDSGGVVTNGVWAEEARLRAAEAALEAREREQLAALKQTIVELTRLRQQRRRLPRAEQHGGAHRR